MTRILLSAAEITVTMSAVILLLILVNRTAGDRFTAGCRYILWCIVMLRLAVPVGAPFQNALIRLEVPSAAETVSFTAEVSDAAQLPVRDAEEKTPSASAETDALPDSAIISPETQENNALPDGIDALIFIGEQDGTDLTPENTVPEADMPDNVQPTRKAPDPERILQWAAVIYLVGAAGYFAFCMTEHLLTAGLLRSSRRTVSHEMQAVYAEQCEKCGIRKRPALYASARVTSPMLFGYFRPCILLPLNMNCPEKAAGILRHELIHRKRGDLWVKLICLIARSFHWFNPLVHMAAGRCCREMELSCDEKVLDGLGEEERKEYGRIMLDVVKYCRRRYSGLTTQFNPRRNVVFERFENILDMRRKKRGAALIALMLAVSLSAGMVLSCTVQSEDTGSSEANSDGSGSAEDLTGTDESYKNSKPAGTERILTEAEIGSYQIAYRSAEAVRELYRIEYDEMLACLAEWNRNSALAETEQSVRKAHDYTELARTYYREYRYAAEFLEKQVPGAMFSSGGIRIPLSPEYSERVVIMHSTAGDAFALVCGKKGDAVTELFRITRYAADELISAEECELDTCYFAFDNRYYYAVQHPYHVGNELRDDIIAEVKEVFLSANPGVTAVNNAVVGCLVSTLAGASYEHCWNNMKNGLWAPSAVIHADVVKGISARLVNRMFEALERGESAAALKVSGVELNGEIAPLNDVILPEDAEIPDPIAADRMDDYFFISRYDGETLYYRIPMGKQYVMQIRFLLSRSVLRFQSVEICRNDGMSESEYNRPASELYDLYHKGTLTAQKLMQYPSVHRDLLDIITEIAENVENGDTQKRDNYSIKAALTDQTKLILPSMYEISAYFRQWEGGDIVYLYRCTAGTYARIEVSVGSSLELKEVSIGNITDLIHDYGDLYALYQADVITHEGLYTHDTVMEMGAELVNTVLSAFRRGMNPNALFAGEGYAEPVVYPGGGAIISDIQPERMRAYAEGEYVGISRVEHPYDCYRIPLHGGFRLEIWYELSEKGMRGINVRIADTIPGSYRTLSRSELYRKVREGDAALPVVLQMIPVQTELSELFEEVFTPLSRKGYPGLTDCPAIQPAGVDRLVAMSSMGKPVLCYSPDGKILYEAGLTLVSDERTSRLEASYVGVRNIGERNLTVLTDCFVDSRRVDCALTLPDLYAFDTVRVHRILNPDGTESCIAQLTLDGESVYLQADVTEAGENVYRCHAGGNPRVLSEAEAENLLNQ